MICVASGCQVGSQINPQNCFEGLICIEALLVLIPAVWGHCFNLPDSSFIGRTKCTRVAKANISGSWASNQMCPHFLLFSLCLSLAISICVPSQTVMLSWMCSKPIIVLGHTWRNVRVESDPNERVWSSWKHLRVFIPWLNYQFNLV